MLSQLRLDETVLAESAKDGWNLTERGGFHFSRGLNPNQVSGHYSITRLNSRLVSIELRRTAFIDKVTSLHSRGWLDMIPVFVYARIWTQASRMERPNAVVQQWSTFVEKRKFVESGDFKILTYAANFFSWMHFFKKLSVGEIFLEALNPLSWQRNLTRPTVSAAGFKSMSRSA